MAEPPRPSGSHQRGEDDKDDEDAAERVEMRKVAGRVRADAVNKLGRMADRHPQVVADVLRRWMNNG